ncbi:MAG: ribonuclease D [Microcoleaceae cyanobacterium]
MFYLTDTNDIEAFIEKCATTNILWLDTEVADYNTRKPRLSLIQVLAESNNINGDDVYILEVLDRSDLTNIFIDKIMANSSIEKVFHNSKYDVKFLGKNQAKNITCTWEMAKQLPYYILPVPNLKLKTLAEKLGNFNYVDKAAQSSNWGQRPLTENQLEYAKMDPVYLAQVHLALLKLIKQMNSEPATEDLDKLTRRYGEIVDEWKMLDSEVNHILERIKLGMQAQKISETSSFKLSSVERTTQKVNFAELATIAQSKGINLDFPINFTRKLQTELGDIVEEVSVQKENNPSWKLRFKGLSELIDRD